MADQEATMELELELELDGAIDWDIEWGKRLAHSLKSMLLDPFTHLPPQSHPSRMPTYTS